jgi:DNA-binding transcriptional regulator YdaS (Cro superfamily)
MRNRYLEIAIDICGNRSKLADNLGIDKGEITKYFKGTRKIPAHVALKIAKLLTEDATKQFEIMNELWLNEHNNTNNDEH